MLSIPLKKSDQANLSRSLEVFILKNYDKATHERLRPFFTALDDNRRNFIASLESSNTESTLQFLELYLSYLTLLESRIPISATDLKFNWTDSYSKTKIPVLTYELEKLSVIHSIAACWSKIGTETDLKSPNGHKVALNAFQSALNWLALARRILSEGVTEQKGDMTVSNLQMWADIMTAQGYFTLYDKLDKQTAKKESIAKLAFSVFKNFESSISYMVNIKTFPKEQENLIRFYCAAFEAAGHFYQALSEKEKSAQTGSGYGFVVTRFKVAEKCITRAMQLKGIRGSPLELGKGLLGQIAAEKASAESDNFTIYMDRVPEESEIVPCDALNMVVAKEVTLRDFPEKDLIMMIVPSEMLGIHKEYEAFITQQFDISKEQVEVALKEVYRSFDGKTFEGVPDKVWLEVSSLQNKNCENELNNVGRIKSTAKEMLDNSNAALLREEAEDEELRKNFGGSWNRPPSSVANSELKKEISMLLTKLEQASSTDEQTISEHNSNKASLDILSLSKEDLNKLIPSADPSVLDQQKVLFGELKSTESSLLATLDSYRQAISKSNPADDLKRIIDQKLNKEEAFENMNLEFSELRDQITDQIEVLKQKQEQYLQLLAGVSVEYRAAEIIDNICKSIDRKRSILSRLEQAAGFYNTFIQRSLNIKSATDDFLGKREQEKQQLLARMPKPQPVPQATNKTVQPTPTQPAPQTLNKTVQPAPAQPNPQGPNKTVQPVPAQPVPGSYSGNTPYTSVAPGGNPGNILYHGPQTGPNNSVPTNVPYSPVPGSALYGSQNPGVAAKNVATAYHNSVPGNYVGNPNPAYNQVPQNINYNPPYAQSFNAPHGYPPQPNPPQGYPPQGYAPNNFAHQAYPPQGYPPQGYPPQGYPPQGYPPQGYPPQGYHPQGYPPQGYPPQNAPQGYPPQPYPGNPQNPNPFQSYRK